MVTQFQMTTGPELHFCAGCPSTPQQPKANRDLNDMLKEAMLDNRQDDRIILTGLAPSQDVTDSVVYRPRLGEHAEFNCSVPVGSNLRDVSWLHQGRTVFEAGRPIPAPMGDTTGQSYNFSHVNYTLIFVVLNVSMRSGGSVHCVDAPRGPAYTPRSRVLQRFMLLPLITRSTEVFAAPDVPYRILTAIEGERVTVPCSIRLPLPDSIFTDIFNHLIWRHKDRIVHGPWEAPYGPLIPAMARTYYAPRDAEFNRPCSTNSPGQLSRVTPYFQPVTLADGGLLECLFRPHRGIHEWIVQTTELLVYPKNATQ
ncbi:uncharacterized protein LOC129590074 isoform X2 [Paramacrobiotus metropolitanus]|uniref:uncharacterized protein LOC129590074 isoform X2 n=1 Tax=Paramacrobiotus metropolitanus TaxID=2943436 RepID=UPI00244588B5|nr:uncharacterized protein LOC129590074 isoform X2 [Paramacrobiotus metropolitanus]